jgi:hypothetical protein
VNQLEFPNFNFVGPGAAAYERDAMLVADPLRSASGAATSLDAYASLTEGGERPAPRALPGRSAPSSRERRAEGAELHRLPCRP